MTCFLNSNLFQSIILILTVGVTLWIYFANKRQNVRNAVTILSLQIKEIEKNIEFLKAESISNNIIQERPVHYSTIIYEENYWLKYNHLFAGRFDTLTYETIDNFYKVATKVKEQQRLIKERLLQSMEYKTKYYYDGILSNLNNIANDTNTTKEICDTKMHKIQDLYGANGYTFTAFIQIEFINGLSNSLNEYKKITDGVAYSTLLKLKKDKHIKRII